MKHKTFTFSRFKALDEGSGEFEALVAMFGNVDLGGDRIIKGAFAVSLRKWASKGRPIPVVFSHQWGDLDSHIGEVLEAKETDDGLWVHAQLDMQDPPAAKVWRLMKRGTLAEFSFAYDIVRERKTGGVNELLELDILEVGPTLIGMNRETQLLTVKGPAAASKIQELHDLAHQLGADCTGKSSGAPAGDSSDVARARRMIEVMGLPSVSKRVSPHPSVVKAQVQVELMAWGSDTALPPSPSATAANVASELLKLGWQ